jgi:poly(3-hydroxybutyrate) depolymerase
MQVAAAVPAVAAAAAAVAGTVAAAVAAVAAPVAVVLAETVAVADCRSFVNPARLCQPIDCGNSPSGGRILSETELGCACDPV